MMTVVNVHFIWLAQIKYLTLPAAFHAWYTNNNTMSSFVCCDAITDCCQVTSSTITQYAKGNTDLVHVGFTFQVRYSTVYRYVQYIIYPHFTHYKLHQNIRTLMLNAGLLTNPMYTSCHCVNHFCSCHFTLRNLKLQ